MFIPNYKMISRLADCRVHGVDVNSINDNNRLDTMRTDDQDIRMENCLNNLNETDSHVTEIKQPEIKEQFPRNNIPDILTENEERNKQIESLQNDIKNIKRTIDNNIERDSTSDMKIVRKTSTEDERKKEKENFIVANNANCNYVIISRNALYAIIIALLFSIFFVICGYITYQYKQTEKKLNRILKNRN